MFLQKPLQDLGMRNTLAIFISILGALILVSAVFVISMAQSLNDLSDRGRTDLALASDRLISGVFSHRQLAVSLAADPRFQSGAMSREEMSDVLLRASGMSGALEMTVLDRDRKIIASSAGRGDAVWLDAPFVQRAFHGALGRAAGVSPWFSRRVFYYAIPIFSEDGPVDGALVTTIDIEAIEADFRGSRPAVIVSDDSGVIFFSNRSELVLRNRRIAPPGPQFVDYTEMRVFNHTIWWISATRYIPRIALHLSEELHQIGMRAEAIKDIMPAVRIASLQASMVGFICLILGSVIFFFGYKRRALARINSVLEERVAARTAEISEMNASLLSEVAERKETEAALRRAQRDLVQAEKLTALGKMSAGISHELNQPLMAIQSYADNASAFIDRSRADTAKQNISKISEISERMARIIRNFRAFARQEKQPMQKVDLVQVVLDAVETVEARLTQQGAALQLDLPEAAVWVQGGSVRLQQVIVNLVVNALDALQDAPRKEISIGLSADGPIALMVQDSGAGIADVDRIFEPFYSTKNVGKADGLGLGLSISYGIVQSFGGTIRGANAQEGGAVFTVELLPWPKEDAA